MIRTYIGWDDARDKLLHLEREQTLLRAGEILGGLFDERHVFRIATGEFVIVRNGETRNSFENNIRMIRGLFRDHNLLIALAGEWRDMLSGSIDSLIHSVLKEAEKEKKTLISHRNRLINSLFTEATGITVKEGEPEEFSLYLEEAEIGKLKHMMEQANLHPLGGSEGTLVLRKPDGSHAELHIRVFLLYTLENHRLYLSTMA